ncbi:MAG: hypothetical protein KC910_10365 [Candidatus Eremiobacteraeota bacterium]|nr:hypothetical protein [Candidatus Eremiobacteraeota bacterium]
MVRRILLGLLLLTLASALAGEKTGTITVYNQTPKPIYVVIAGRNQGQIGAWSYDCYTVGIGEHRVEVSNDVSSASKYVRVSETYPDNSWTVTPGEF